MKQWEFVYIRRRVEKGRYYLERNQLSDAEEAALEAESRGGKDNAKVLGPKGSRGGKTKLSSLSPKVSFGEGWGMGMSWAIGWGGVGCGGEEGLGAGPPH